MFFLVIIMYAALAIYEYVPLYKEKQMREFIVNLALGVFSFAIAILLSLDVNIPSPETPIREFINYFLRK